MNDKPVNSRSARAVWLNVAVMLDNCFVLSNMIRHNVPDVNGQAEKKAQKFLSQTNRRMEEEFGYFKDFMASLKEDIKEKEFEEILTTYLTKVVKLAG
jgi:DNA-binding cell septation regulator SpoVG